MIGLPVKAMDGQAEQYGKKVSDLQKDVRIGGGRISGTLNKVESFDGFGTEEAKKPHHYLALDFGALDADRITTRITTAGEGKEVDATTDKFCIYMVKDKDDQEIEVSAERGGRITARTYSLRDLVLAS